VRARKRVVCRDRYGRERRDSGLIRGSAVRRGKVSLNASRTGVRRRSWQPGFVAMKTNRPLPGLPAPASVASAASTISEN